MKQTPEPKTERERVNAALTAEEFLDQTPATKLDILNINKIGYSQHQQATGRHLETVEIFGR